MYTQAVLADSASQHIPVVILDVLRLHFMLTGCYCCKSHHVVHCIAVQPAHVDRHHSRQQKSGYSSIEHILQAELQQLPQVGKKRKAAECGECPSA